MSDALTFTVLGSCSGTEPVPGRHHTAMTLSHGGRLYWLDAGETCSYSAHLSGIDLPSTESIFISHTHMDHIGGLPNLLWTLRKLTAVSPEARQKLSGRTLSLFIPDLAVYEGILAILRGTEGGFNTLFRLVAARCEDGVLYDRHGLRVLARHNHHLGMDPPFKSFSFRIEAGGRILVYSGDVRGVQDIEALIPGADLLLMETGHHRVEDVCRTLLASKADFGRLLLVHHGRAVLEDPAREIEVARRILGDRVLVAEDGLELKL